LRRQTRPRASAPDFASSERCSAYGKKSANPRRYTSKAQKFGPHRTPRLCRKLCRTDAEFLPITLSDACVLCGSAVLLSALGETPGRRALRLHPSTSPWAASVCRNRICYTRGRNAPLLGWPGGCARIHSILRLLQHCQCDAGNPHARRGEEPRMATFDPSIQTKLAHPQADLSRLRTSVPTIATRQKFISSKAECVVPNTDDRFLPCRALRLRSGYTLRSVSRRFEREIRHSARAPFRMTKEKVFTRPWYDALERGAGGGGRCAARSNARQGGHNAR
jgi:hypothetical protein